MLQASTSPAQPAIPRRQPLLGVRCQAQRPALQAPPDGGLLGGLGGLSVAPPAYALGLCLAAR